MPVFGFFPPLHGLWPLGESSAGHYRMDNVQHKGTTRYNAKGMTKPVNFLCIAPEAHEVAIIGDFNNWESGKHLMNRQIDGSWSAQIDLHHGHHRYQFVIDGKPTLDPRANGVVRNEANERVSLIAVS